MLDVRRLRVLHAVSAYGSVTAAAAALGYSAPAVSQQLAALEREVGMRLTERAGRGVELTPAAHILVGHTDALLARLDAAETDVAAAHEYDLLPRPLDPLFERRELLDDPVVLAIPADSALSLARLDPVPLASLAGQPFLAPRQATSCAEMIQRACARAGFVPRVVARASDFQVLLSLVAAGAGVTLVPGLAARWLPPRVRLVPPADPVTRRVFTVSRRGGDRKPAVRVVLDALSDAAAEPG